MYEYFIFMSFAAAYVAFKVTHLFISQDHIKNMFKISLFLFCVLINALMDTSAHSLSNQDKSVAPINYFLIQLQNAAQKRVSL